MMGSSLENVFDQIPDFVRRVGMGLVRLVERVAPAADALEPFAALIGWGMFLVAAVIIVMCMSGLLSRR